LYEYRRRTFIFYPPAQPTVDPEDPGRQSPAETEGEAMTETAEAATMPQAPDVFLKGVQQTLDVMRERSQEWLAQRATLISELTKIHREVTGLLDALKPSVDLDAVGGAAAMALADLAPHATAMVELDTPAPRKRAHRSTAHRSTNGSGKALASTARDSSKLHWTQRPENADKLARAHRAAARAKAKARQQHV